VADTWEISELDNGLRVVTTPVGTAQSVSVNIFVAVGSRGEDRRENGLSHYLEHMVFKGTQRWPSALAISETIEGAGGVLNAYTGKELTCYWNQVPFDRLDLALEVLADMVINPLLNQEEIDRERTVVQQEIKRAHDQPSAWASELLSRACYGDQPIGWPIAGSEETVAGLQRRDFTEHMRRWYTPKNMVLSVAGNTSHRQVLSAARKLFGGLEAHPPPPFEPARDGIPSENIFVENRDISQCNLGIALRALPRKDPDRYAFMVLNSILGRGMSSRLFKEVRERRGLAYAVGSSISRYNDTGSLAISAGVSPEKLQEATRVILEEVFKLAQEPVPKEEMLRARDYTVGTFRLSLETTMALAQRAGENLLTTGEIEPVEEVAAKLKAITSEDVLRVARRLLRRDNLAAAVVGPGTSREEMSELLAA
jgi:predicted Zn-dependent peptidase